MAVETTNTRRAILATALIGTTIAIAVSLNAPIETPNIEIRGKSFTPSEYAQIKTDVVAIMKNRKTIKPTFEEAELWKAILNRECKNVTLTDVTSENLVEKLNNKLELGC